MEFSGGVRYNEYVHRDADNDGNSDEYFHGIGMIMGIEARHCVGCGTLYGRARHAILVGDSTDFSEDPVQEREDVILAQLELGAGYEVERCIAGRNATLRAGVEYQDYFSYEDTDEDVGFFGFLIGGTVNY